MKKILIKFILLFIPIKLWRKKFRRYLKRKNTIYTICKIRDNLIKKHNDYWCFPVCCFNHRLDDNSRAIFDKIKNNSKIKKIVLVRDKKLILNGKNVVIVPLKSKEGLDYLIKSKVIFVKHSFKHNVGYDLNYKKHLIINLWHGIPLKKIGVTSAKSRSLELDFINHQLEHSFVISSSLVDRAMMTSAMHPLTYNQVWLTGLPRCDLIVNSEKELPLDYKKELEEITIVKGDKKIIFFAPTFRDNQEKSYFQFSKEEIYKLKSLLDRNNAILAIREHMADTTRSFSNQLKTLKPLDFNKYNSIEMCFRMSDILITDYSSCFIDFMLTNKPIVNFAYDYEEYKNNERGFLYEMEMVFPDKINKNFNDMIISLEKLLEETSKEYQDHYNNCKKMFFKYTDNKNSDRVIKNIEKELKGEVI